MDRRAARAYVEKVGLGVGGRAGWKTVGEDGVQIEGVF